jgi:hypothetical protein
MKSAIAIVFFRLFVGIASAQVGQPSSEKVSYFEAQARRGQTRVIGSQEAGHLTGGESHAIFTNLILEDPTPEHRRIRGVRIDLSQPDWNTSIYVDEELLQPLKKTFDQMESTRALISDLVVRGVLPGIGNIGSCEHRTHAGRHPIEATLTYEADLPILILNAVRFPGLMPSQVSDVLAKAIDELRAR